MQTAQLILRPFTIDDAPDFFALTTLADIIRYTGEQPQSSVDDARRILVERPLRDYAVYGFGRMACIEKSSGRLVGFSGLKFLEDLQEVDVGYRFLPDCWGKGYATESAQALMQHGEAVYGIRRFVGMVHPLNGASERVLQKLGLVYDRDLPPAEDGTAFRLYATPGTGPQDGYRPRGRS